MRVSNGCGIAGRANEGRERERCICPFEVPLSHLSSHALARLLLALAEQNIHFGLACSGGVSDTTRGQGCRLRQPTQRHRSFLLPSRPLIWMDMYRYPPHAIWISLIVRTGVGLRPRASLQEEKRAREVGIGREFWESYFHIWPPIRAEYLSGGWMAARRRNGNGNGAPRLRKQDRGVEGREAVVPLKSHH